MTAEPYLSLVVTARNDDHGGNLLGRMQAFINGWLNQARRCELPSELIIVEWNPPADRPRLAEALRWPVEPGPCLVRIIEVPAELHRRYAHSAALPLYQMIGKNVGIRRARGQFVLATNIDILFSSELMAFLSERRLDPGRMYRIDRYDAMSGVPVDGTPEEQLAYCRSHLIRINRREGTFANERPAKQPEPARPASQPEPELVHPIAAPEPEPVCLVGPPEPLSGIRLGEGWFPREHHPADGDFYWASQRSTMRVEEPPKGERTLELEIEPGPGTGVRPLDLEVVADGAPIGRFSISRRCRLRIGMCWTAGVGLLFVVHRELVPAGRDPRALGFRLLRAKWVTRGWVGRMPAASLVRLSLRRRFAIISRAVTHLAFRLATEGPLVNITVPVSPALRRTLKKFSRFAGPPNLRPTVAQQHQTDGGAPVAQEQQTDGKAPVAQERRTDGEAPVPLSAFFLHTNGCGDFTLLARARWVDLRGYPEFNVFSMNLDSVFCYAAHHGGAVEEVLSEPMRIYHIEHGTGSGWTPEGQAKLFERIAAKGIPVVPSDEVIAWGAQMRRLNSPMIFNLENWGLADFALPETEILPAPRAEALSRVAAHIDE
jgi:hypothetical protein